MHVQLGWGTDPGLQRSENEDSVLVWQDRAGLEVLLVVCDGMGGHAAGHLASTIASETFASTLEKDGGGGPDTERLRRASAEANAAVHDAAMKNAAWAGMGSTLTVVAVDKGELALVNVGDSPAWLFRGREARLISQDHSWPAEQVRLGMIKPEEAKDHPMKHRLTRAVGIWDKIAAYTASLELEPGDVVVLCSDGVETAGVSVEQMRDMLAGDLEEGIQRVIGKCRELGAPDNVSVAAIRIEGDKKAREKTQLMKTAVFRTVKTES